MRHYVHLKRYDLSCLQYRCQDLTITVRQIVLSLEQKQFNLTPEALENIKAACTDPDKLENELEKSQVFRTSFVDCKLSQFITIGDERTDLSAFVNMHIDNQPGIAPNLTYYR